MANSIGPLYSYYGPGYTMYDEVHKKAGPGVNTITISTNGQVYTNDFTKDAHIHINHMKQHLKKDLMRKRLQKKFALKNTNNQ
jgi:hypothetical protein